MVVHDLPWDEDTSNGGLHTRELEEDHLATRVSVRRKMAPRYVSYFESNPDTSGSHRDTKFDHSPIVLRRDLILYSKSVGFPLAIIGGVDVGDRRIRCSEYCWSK